MDDPIALCAAGEAACQAAAHAGLRASWRTNPQLAWCPVAVHPFLLAAVTLVPRPALPLELIDEAPGIVRDSWAVLSPDDLPGWSPEPHDPWMVRAPGPLTLPPVPGVRIAPTTDALRFEETAFLAASGAPPRQTGELHPEGSHAFPGLTLLLAHRDGRPIGTALAVFHGHGVVISAVAVLAEERGRGVGAALTATAVRCAPDLPATLTASRLGRGTYRRLGFHEVGRPLDWHPPRSRRAILEG